MSPYKIWTIAAVLGTIIGVVGLILLAIHLAGAKPTMAWQSIPLCTDEMFTHPSGKCRSEPDAQHHVIIYEWSHSNDGSGSASGQLMSFVPMVERDAR